MKPEDRHIILGLVFDPRERTRQCSPDEVLDHFGTSDGRTLGLNLLIAAETDRDSSGVELAIIVCNEFGFDASHLDVLIRLSYANSHRSHEALITMLGELHDPAAVAALGHAAFWIPEHLYYDENRALARKAIWALGGIPGPEAEIALTQISNSESDIVKRGAEKQLQRRKNSADT